MEDAPYRADLAEGPKDVRCLFVRASDDVQLRVALWSVDAAKGTILLFPGRTEYIEKYGRVARDLTDAGFDVAAIDWRGQGFSDRLADDRLLGHVLEFQDYQKDAVALVTALEALGTAKPLYLLAHSMGGAIGLRALINGFPVERVVFSAPMWGISIPTSRRALAAVLPTLARMAGQGLRTVPGSRPIVYDVELGFAENPLTCDRDHFAFFSAQLQAEKQFTLGAPSLHWFGEALSECRVLRGLPRPKIPALISVGTDECVVSVPDIRKVHANWIGAALTVIDGARHELMMEAPDIRSRFLRDAVDFFLSD